MGQVLTADIEIQAPPEAVRKVFLNFPEYKSWAPWTITPKADAKADGTQMKAGDSLTIGMPNASFTPVVQENKPELFAWLGSLPFIFTGRHEFRFHPSEQHPGGTRFEQSENFTGLLSFLVAPGWSMRKSSAATWNKFNEDLKAEVEKRST